MQPHQRKGEKKKNIISEQRGSKYLDSDGGGGGLFDISTRSLGGEQHKAHCIIGMVRGLTLPSEKNTTGNTVQRKPCPWVEKGEPGTVRKNRSLRSVSLYEKEQDPDRGNTTGKKKKGKVL